VQAKHIFSSQDIFNFSVPNPSQEGNKNMIISEEQFEILVSDALDSLPDNFKDKMNNVAIIIEDFPTKEQTKKLRLGSQYSLFGLYEGCVQSKRLNYGVVLPDKITIFRKPIMQSCSNEQECQKQIFNTVRHEIAHHFGSDEKGARKAASRKGG
jgi:predicted Zn-dependent protease with MMP-like domain